jgi:hypothetical protein
MSEDPKLRIAVHCAVITRDDAIEELEESLQRAADEAHTWLVLECGLDEREERAAMQQVYVALDGVRQRGVAEIDRIWETMVEATPEVMH